MSIQQRTKVIFFCMVTVVSMGMAGFPALGQKSVIRFLTDENAPATQKVYKEMEERFEAAYPKYDLQIEYISYGDIWPKLMSSLQAKTPPELAYMDADFVVDLVNGGFIRDVSSVVEKVGEGGASDYDASILRLVQQRGDTFGVPNNCSIMFMAYRKHLLEEAGLAVPETWDEYLHSLAKLTEGRKIRGINLFLGSIHAEQWLIMAMWSNGGYMFGKPNGPCTLDMPENIEALEYLKKLWPYTASGAPSDTYTDAFMRFVNGELATIWTYGRTLGNIQQYNPGIVGDVGLVPVPKPLTGSRTSPLWPTYFTIFKDADEIEGAEEFIEFHMRPEENIPILASAAVQLVPLRKSVARGEILYRNPILKTWKDALELQTQLIPYGRSVGFEHGIVCYKSTKLTKSPILVDTMYDALVKGLSAEEALKKAVLRTEELVKE